jgi:hypothetical protein
MDSRIRGNDRFSLILSLATKNVKIKQMDSRIRGNDRFSLILSLATKNVKIKQIIGSYHHG